MNSRLDNLFLYLVENKIFHLQSWHNDYKEQVDSIAYIRKELINGKSLTDLTIYVNSIYVDSKGFNNSFEVFMDRLIKKPYNGVASNGQSIVSWKNFYGDGKFMNSEIFINSVEELIKNPTLPTYNDFRKCWIDQGADYNKLLINRTAAACTLSVSSTVDENKFNEVFDWMVKESLIGAFSGSDNWFEKNEFLISEIDKDLKLNKGDKYWRSIFVWMLYEYIGNPFNLKKQIVKYGAPGTGKTYGAIFDADLQFKIWKTENNPGEDFYFEEQREIVQFHPSFSYEDFIEGLRPILKEGKAELSLQNGIFKSFCKKAAKWEIDIYELVGEKFDWVKSDIKYLEQNKDFNSLKEKDHWKFVFDQENRGKRVVDVLPPYFFIIDEINRAELSRVLGELMYSLEYRGIKGKIKTQYANLNSDETCLLKIKDASLNYQFFIPQNVYIIGTMNTIDRSVESFDFALRRRFIWEEIHPDIEMLKKYLILLNKDWGILADNLQDLNEKIKGDKMLGNDFQIGHSYLMNLPYKKFIDAKEIRNNVWSTSIQPLIEEYLRGTGKTIVEFAKAFGIN